MTIKWKTSPATEYEDDDEVAQVNLIDLRVWQSHDDNYWWEVSFGTQIMARGISPTKKHAKICCRDWLNILAYKIQEELED